MTARDALNRVCKWRMLFVGWQLGTRSKEDPEAQALRNHVTTTICLRVENNALAILLVEKGIFTRSEWEAAIIKESKLLDEMYEARFPGWKSTDHGLIAVDVAKAAETTKGWKP